MAAKKRVVGKKRKVETLEKVWTTTHRQHWSAWLVDELQACSAPSEMQDARTPQEGWDAATGDQLSWVLSSAAEIELSDEKFYDARNGSWDAAKIRKQYPTPPRAVMASLNKWLKDVENDEVDDDYYGYGNYR